MAWKRYALLFVFANIAWSQDSSASIKTVPGTSVVSEVGDKSHPLENRDTTVINGRLQKKGYQKLDHDLLDPEWFGSDIKFAEGGIADYFWIKPGLSLANHVVWVKPWDDPVMLDNDRSAKDSAKAFELTDVFPGLLRGALNSELKGRIKFSRNEGDIALVGRFVDAKAGSRMKKALLGFGAGSDSATWDFKLVDTKTGELLMACHHRVISITLHSTVNDKLLKWVGDFAPEFAAIVAPLPREQAKESERDYSQYIHSR